MKIDKFLILIFLAILFLNFAAYWQLRSFQEVLREIEIPKLEMPKIELFPVETEKITKEFTSPDGKLKFQYSSDWMEITKKGFEQHYQETVIAEAKVLFLAQKFNLEKMTFAFLIVQEFGNEKSLEEIIKEMKASVKEREGEMKILKLDEEKGIFEARYEKENQPAFHSLKRVLKGENKTYLIIVLTSEKDWPELENESYEILNSIQIIK